MASGERPFWRRIIAAQYKLYDRMRHRSAFEVAGQPATGRGFEEFRPFRQCLLITFKRSGDAVPAPVNFGLSEDGKLYVRTEADSAKVRRLRRAPEVRVCPCTFRGKPRGPVVEGRARVVPESEHRAAYATVASNWDLASRVFEGIVDRIGVPVTYVEITPAPDSVG